MAQQEHKGGEHKRKLRKIVGVRKIEEVKQSKWMYRYLGSTHDSGNL